MPTADGTLVPGDPGYTTPANSTGMINNTSVPNPAPSPDAGQPLAPPPAAVATQATAVPFTVGDNQTVAGQVQKIINQDSPLIQQANARAMAKMNERGLLNSSQAITAGQSAVFDAALPIATADAATFDRAASNTAAAQNAVATQNAQLATGVSQSNLQSGTTLTVSGNQNTTQKAISDATLANQKDIAAINSNTSMSIADKQAAIQDVVSKRATETQLNVATINAQSAIANIDAQGTVNKEIQRMSDANKALLQSSSAAAELYKSSMAALTSISTDPNIADKQGSMNNIMATLNDGLVLVGNIVKLNLGSNLTFTGP